MAEQETSQPFRWERSPEYRNFHSDHFKFRFSAGEGDITFSKFTGDPGSINQNVAVEQVNISMAWTQLKMLGEYITIALQEMEREVGPIVSIGVSKEELQKQAAAIIKDFVIRKK